MDFDRWKLEVEDGDADIVFEQLAQDVLVIAMAGGMPVTYWTSDARMQRACHVLNMSPEEAYAWALNFEEDDD